MGAWGTGPFENDDALDWLARFEGEGAAAVEAALDAVLDAVLDGTAAYLERDLGASALAAAEVVAAMRGRPGPELPPQVASLAAARTGAPSAAPRARTRRAVDRAADPRHSEVAELWAEVDDGAVWRRAVDELRRRLA